ncbi:protein crumbs homolog 3 isoform X2 [Pteropus alecto]|uniref:protein crumbs homolog 3 isoform X2 n=1 Tax=Pteropus alecto TaxID=9402 RepID=UPI00076886E7|nr:protein crumbs homolog 3 isoform X2 [Pteropus alecto]
MACPSLGLLLAFGLPLLLARWGRAWGQSSLGPLCIWKQHQHHPPPQLQCGPVEGGHHRDRRGLLPPGRPAPGRGAGAAGAETAGEAADGRQLPAQQRGAALPRSRGPGSPGLQGDSEGLPAHLAPLPLSVSLPYCVTLGEGRCLPGPSHSPSSVLKNRRVKGASKSAPEGTGGCGCSLFIYVCKIASDI